MPDHDNAYRQTMNQISALMDLMRPMINQVGRMTDNIGRYDAEFNKIGRHFHDLRQEMISLRTGQMEIRSELSEFKSDLTARLDAIFIRLDDIENTGLRNETAIRNLASEMVLQHNTILNALQDSHNNKLALDELSERVGELERQVRQLRNN